MAFILFESSGMTVGAKDCTARWPATVSCEILMSGIYAGKQVNLMKMEGTGLKKWLNENAGKVRELAKTEADKIGQYLSPKGVREVNCLECGTLIKKEFGLFDAELRQEIVVL